MIENIMDRMRYIETYGLFPLCCQNPVSVVEEWALYSIVPMPNMDRLEKKHIGLPFPNLKS